MNKSPHPETIGVILAGGRARRMGGQDKAFVTLGGEPIIAHVARRFTPQCLATIVSANGDPSRLNALLLPVVPDTLPDYPGPLAGILAALEWVATHYPAVDWVASATVDTPFIPDDLVARLHGARKSQNAQLAIAQSVERNHPTCGLWPVSSRGSLREALLEEEMRKVGDWISRHTVATATWPNDLVDPFFNINTLEELAIAQRIVNPDGV